MSNRKKIAKKANANVTPLVVKEPVQTPPSSSLINFDQKTKLFLLVMLFLYIGLSTFKIHTSSIAYWNTAFDLPKSKAVLWSVPKRIRMDEWMTSTTTLIGHYRAGMPVNNPSIGSGNVPVIWGFPVKDKISLLRPAVWSYFLFDVERAFAFSWNFNIFFFLISMFLLLMLVTRSNFWLSVFGTLFIFFSSGVQWWSYYISNYMMYMNGMLISFVYILYSKKTIPLILAGVFFLFSTYGYLFNLYPPFQVPLVYLYLFIFLGFVWRQQDFKSIRENISVKAGVFAVLLILLGYFVFHYYQLTKDTYAIMLNTVYPGQRVATGGDLASGKLFSEFFGLFMTDKHVPKEWMNISEVSGFLLFLPVLIYRIGFNYYKFKTVDKLQLALTAFLILSMLYIVVGFPVFLSKLSLLSMVEARRFLPIAEVGNCILLICLLSDNQPAEKGRFSWVEFAVLFFSFIVFFTLVGNHINDSTENFFTKNQLKTVTALFTVIYLLIRYSYLKYATTAACILILGITISNANVNPLTAGLSPVLENPLVITSRAIYEKDPDAVWAVFGASNQADLLKSVGIKVFNGIKVTPPLEELALLDSTGKDEEIYNRLAHIRMQEFIDWKDSVIFTQTIPDRYIINMDPCSPRLAKLGIKYFLFTQPPAAVSLRCMTAVDSLQFFIYKRKEE